MINAFDSEVILTGCASGEEFIRMPNKVISQVERLRELSTYTSGIRARIITDSKTLMIKAENGKIADYVHMPVSGTSGFDIYVNNIFKANIRPLYNTKKIEEAVELQKGNTMNIIDIYFPLYNSITSFSFELEKGALKEIPEIDKKPVLFYGSSITQGACASRPGLTYVNMLGQMLGRPVINLGFSGNARGDIPIAEYIASIELAAFVYDYDHNAPDTKWLKETHEPFFKEIRKTKPELPVVMLSRPGYERWIDTAKYNTAVVMTTYLKALKSGDENVYFVDGRILFGTEGRDRCSGDGTHPNDIGFMRMAKTVCPVLKEILED